GAELIEIHHAECAVGCAARYARRQSSEQKYCALVPDPTRIARLSGMYVPHCGSRTSVPPMRSVGRDGPRCGPCGPADGRDVSAIITPMSRTTNRIATVMRIARRSQGMNSITHPC